MVQVVICIGSNSPRKKFDEVAAALRYLCQLLKVPVMSVAYTTCATSDSVSKLPYFNAILSGYTEICLDRLHRILKTYEHSRGRNCCDKTVLIDLDLVIYDNKILRSSDFSATYFQIGYSLLGHTIPITRDDTMDVQEKVLNEP